MLSAYRNRALWFSLVVSFALHLVGLIYLGTLDREEEDRAFRARLAVIPRFEPRRLGATRPRKPPRSEMEYLPSSAVPGRLSAEEEMSPADVPALVVPPGLPTAPRTSVVGGKPDTLVLARERLPRAADFDWTHSVDREQAFDLLRMRDLAGRDRKRAAVVLGQTTRRDVSGYVNLTRLKVYGAGTDPRDTASGLDALARYVRDHTGILARVTGVRYDYFLSEDLLEDPVHFLIGGGGWEPYRNEYLTQFSDEEKAMLGRYLREGGFLFIEGGYRYLTEMVGNLKEILGKDGRLFPVPVSHPVYHSYYEFAGGFPSEDHKEDVVDVAGSSWYYSGSLRADDLVPDNPTVSPEQDQQERLPNLGIWGVEVNGEMVAMLSDLEMYARWASSFQSDASSGGSELFLQAGTNILVYAMTRRGGVTDKRPPSAWAQTRPAIPPGPKREATAESPEAEAELFADLDASLALIQSPYGTVIAHNGLSIELDGRYSLDLLKRGAHGLILHNLPAGDHWLELSYGGKTSQMEVRLEGGKVSTVTFGLSRLAMFSSLRIKQQEEVVAVEHWLRSFVDLTIEELFLGEDKHLLE